MNVAFGQETIYKRSNLGATNRCRGGGLCGNSHRRRDCLIDRTRLECNAFNIHEVSWRNVVRRNIAAPRSTTKRHGRLEIGCETNRAVRGRAVDDDSRCGHANAVFASCVAALCVYRSGVAHPAVSEDLCTALAAFFEILDHVVSKEI